MDITRTLLIDSGLTTNFLAEAVNTTCYVPNTCLIKSLINKTLHELLNDRKPLITQLRVFEWKCFVLNYGENDLGKFDGRSDEGVLVVYSFTSKAYKIFNKRSLSVEESMHVKF